MRTSGVICIGRGDAHRVASFCEAGRDAHFFFQIGRARKTAHFVGDEWRITRELTTFHAPEIKLGTTPAAPLQASTGPPRLRPTGYRPHRASGHE